MPERVPVPAIPSPQSQQLSRCQAQPPLLGPQGLAFPSLPCTRRVAMLGDLS